ncbi:hypothetical protein VCCP1040_1464, partial [Vibrio cholerae CP1040(13)]
MLRYSWFLHHAQYGW